MPNDTIDKDTQEAILSIKQTASENYTKLLEFVRDQGLDLSNPCPTPGEILLKKYIESMEYVFSLADMMSDSKDMTYLETLTKNLCEAVDSYKKIVKEFREL